MNELEMNPITSAPYTSETDADNITDNDVVTEDAEVTDDKDAEVSEEDTSEVDYGEIERQDLSELKSIFPHLRDKSSILELDNPLRYAALRDLGLSPKEAYLATSEPIRKYDNRSHLISAVPKSASSPADLLSRGELEAARELFSGLSDRELQRLYKTVTK